ncbi:hypothetical protein AGMMS4957_19930 [Bacteroidia bacterium]|nr:hypothetical protein AGMMS4957_19930 [Bacteroidia bacterium]
MKKKELKVGTKLYFVSVGDSKDEFCSLKSTKIVGFKEEKGLCLQQNPLIKIDGKEIILYGIAGKELNIGFYNSEFIKSSLYFNRRDAIKSLMSLVYRQINNHASSISALNKNLKDIEHNYIEVISNIKDINETIDYNNTPCSCSNSCSKNE